ncbi:MAG: M24 family metallopeptidase [Oscillatoriales cyanobacterium SM2_2_1]|nr:M24 family metallopeptidase [Oscillatoriales cyanobacterium SM2_2_1]
MVAERLAALRALLKSYCLDAYLIATADEHLNEYPLPNRLRRQWISGFSGSAGDLLVGLESAWLFVDSRYHEQAEQQVDPQYVAVSKLGLEGALTLEQIVSQSQWQRLGLDPWTTTIEQSHRWQEHCALHGGELVPVTPNLVDILRDPAELTPSAQPLRALPESLTGAAVANKLAAVRSQMQHHNAAILPVTKLDQIAWLFNLRGQDIPHNPVFLAYAIVTLDSAYLFRDAIDGAIAAQLPGIEILPYDQYEVVLAGLATTGDRLLLAPRQTTWGTQLLLKEVPAHWQEAEHPIEQLKARKNAIELAQMRAANLKASYAKTLTLMWVETETQAGKHLSERDVADYIEALYAQSEGYIELSFPTIAGVGANSSIVHYGNPSATVALTPGSLLLLDSGCQFWGGTTDDTRATIIGSATDEQKKRYTAVLKSHINCARQIFPRGPPVAN